MQFFNVRHIPHRHVAVALEGREIRKIGDSRQPNHRDVQKLPLGVPAEPLGQAVLVVDIHMDIGNHPRHGNVTKRLQCFQARLQNGLVAPEFVDHRALDPGPLVFFEKGHGAVELSEHAAPVDVTYQKNGGVHHFGKAHVDNVLILEVNLGGAARSLDDDDVIFSGKGMVAFHDLRHKLPLAAVVFHGPHIAPDLTVHDDLTAHVGGGFQQNGVHAYVRGDAGGLRLHHLRPTHFSAVCGDEGIQGHILALEGGHPVAVLPEYPAQTGAQQALARIGHGALNHDIFRHGHSPKTPPMAEISFLFSSCRRTAMRYQPEVRPG